MSDKNIIPQDRFDDIRRVVNLILYPLCNTEYDEYIGEIDADDDIIKQLHLYYYGDDDCIYPHSEEPKKYIRKCIDNGRFVDSKWNELHIRLFNLSCWLGSIAK